MKLIEQIEIEIDEYLADRECERKYNRIERPKVEQMIREFRMENREFAEKCRTRFNGQKKKEYIRLRDEYIKTNDDSLLMEMQNIKYRTRNLDDARSVPIMEIFNMYGYSPIDIGNNRKKLCCPFHNEKSPSLVVYLETNSFYCFGCGLGGSPIDLIINLESCSVGRAIKILCG